jgi:protein required for attachment to host cells
MNNVWVVVASSTRCRIFTQRTHNGALLLLDELSHPEGRLHSRDLNSDRPGRSFDSQGEGRHAMGEPTDPVEQENLRFAKTIATILENARKKTQFDRLALVADPRFLGYLRHELSSITRQCVSTELQKNLAEADPEVIRQALPYRV